MEMWELEAREAIRTTLAQYNHSGDRGRASALAEQFLPDGVLEIHDSRTFTGREAITEGLGATVSGRMETAAPDAPPPIVRHHVSSVLIESVAPDEAHVASYFAVYTRNGLDHWGRYRDTLRPLEGRWLIAHRFVRVDAAVSGSWFHA